MLACGLVGFCSFHTISSAVEIDILELMKSDRYGLYVDGCV